MSVAIQSWEQVLADADEETAALIIASQIEDAETDTFTPNTQTNADFLNARTLWIQELKNYQAIRSTTLAIEAPQPPEEIVKFECIICQDNFGADDCSQVPCEHYYCDGCLNDLFRVAMTDEQTYPPRCCRQPVPFEDARRFLNHELADEFADKQEELDDPKPTYCYVPTCSTYIGEGKKDDDVATCPSCNAKTCILCKQAQHDGDCVEDHAVAETMRLAQQNGWQRCPQCERLIELRIGCNHMTCLCKAEFCYVCRSHPWKACECPQFHEHRLYERAQEIVERDGEGNADEIAAGLREHHECVNDDNDWEYVEGRHDCEVCGDTLRAYISRCRRCRFQSCARCRHTRL